MGLTASLTQLPNCQILEVLFQYDDRKYTANVFEIFQYDCMNLFIPHLCVVHAVMLGIKAA
jgi:hypothetical protein